MKKTVEMLRKMQYQRFRTTRKLRDMQKTARLPGIDIVGTLQLFRFIETVPKELER